MLFASCLLPVSFRFLLLFLFAFVLLSVCSCLPSVSKQRVRESKQEANSKLTPHTFLTSHTPHTSLHPTHLKPHNQRTTKHVNDTEIIRLHGSIAHFCGMYSSFNSRGEAGLYRICAHFCFCFSAAFESSIYGL